MVTSRDDSHCSSESQSGFRKILGIYQSKSAGHFVHTVQVSQKMGLGPIHAWSLDAQGLPKLSQLFTNDSSNILRVFSDPINDPRLAAVEPREANEIQTALC